MTTAARALIHTATSETHWQDVVIQWARYEGWLVSAMRDSRDLWWGTDPGIPDLVMARWPRVIFAELKDMKGRLSDYQKLWASELFGSSAEYYWWRPSDEDAVRAVLA